MNKYDKGVEALLNEGYTRVYSPPMGKIRRFLFIWRNGRYENYPICCIFRFSLENALEDGKTRWIKDVALNHRGSVKRADGNSFVPCNLFHHKTED